jgi:hypothetical protein
MSKDDKQSGLNYDLREASVSYAREANFEKAEEILKLVSDGAKFIDVEITDKLLSAAAKEGRLDVIGIMPTESYSPDGLQTAFEQAITHGKTKVASYLTTRGAAKGDFQNDKAIDKSEVTERATKLTANLLKACKAIDPYEFNKNILNAFQEISTHPFSLEDRKPIEAKLNEQFLKLSTVKNDNKSIIGKIIDNICDFFADHFGKGSKQTQIINEAKSMIKDEMNKTIDKDVKKSTIIPKSILAGLKGSSITPMLPEASLPMGEVKASAELSLEAKAAARRNTAALGELADTKSIEVVSSSPIVARPDNKSPSK